MMSGTMSKILLPSKGNNPPKDCEGRKRGVARGSYYEFEVSNEEFKFWKAISNEERDKLREEAYNRCFYDVLKEYMQNNPKKSTSVFGHIS
jgi:hypothetical protein